MKTIMDNESNVELLYIREHPRIEVAELKWS